MKEKDFRLCDIVFTVVDSNGQTETYVNQVKVVAQTDVDEKLVKVLEQLHIERISLSIYKNSSAFMRHEKDISQDVQQKYEERKQRRVHKREESNEQS